MFEYPPYPIIHGTSNKHEQRGHPHCGDEQKEDGSTARASGESPTSDGVASIFFVHTDQHVDGGTSTEENRVRDGLESMRERKLTRGTSESFSCMPSRSNARPDRGVHDRLKRTHIPIYIWLKDT